MYKYSILFAMITAAVLAGCGGDKSALSNARLAGYIQGCQDSVHELAQAVGMGIDESKLTAYCLKNGQEAAKKSK